MKGDENKAGKRSAFAVVRHSPPRVSNSQQHNWQLAVQCQQLFISLRVDFICFLTFYFKCFVAYVFVFCINFQCTAYFKYFILSIYFLCEFFFTPASISGIYLRMLFILPPLMMGFTNLSPLWMGSFLKNSLQFTNHFRVIRRLQLISSASTHLRAILKYVFFQKSCEIQ